MKKFGFLIIAMLVLSAVSCASAIKRSESVDVSLNGNATTGYLWFCSIEDEDIVKLSNSEYIVNNSAEGRVGVGGQWIFSFEGVSDGQTSIIFKYSRPWENDSIETKNYEAKVKNGFLTIKEKN